MWFLIVQILLLMLLAGFLGAWLAWWWVQRNVEDVTETYESLQETPTIDFDLDPVNDKLSGVETALSTRLDTLEARLTAPSPDLDAIQSRLVAISDRLPDRDGPDLEPLKSRLSHIEEQLEDLDLGAVHSSLALLELAIKDQEFPQTDLSDVHAHLESLKEKIEVINTRMDEAPGVDMDAFRTELKTELQDMPGPDLSPVFERMSGVERAVVGLQAPDLDLSEVLEKLEQLEAKVEEPVVFDVPTQEKDFESLHQRLQAIEHNIHALNIAPTDLSGVEQRMTSLENFLQSPNPDFDILHTRLTALEASIEALDRAPTDLTPFYSRFSAIDSAIQSLRSEYTSQPGLDNLEHRLASLQDSLMRMPQTDITPVLETLHTVESRIDMGALEDRLTAIEYGLAAMHQMLRTRPEPPRPAPQQTYTPPPEYMRPRPAPAPPQTYAMPPRAQPPRQTYPAPPPPPPPMPRRDADPLRSARRPGDEANLLTDAVFGEGDDLELINGVGPMLGSLLNDIGVFYFWQIADWSHENVDYVDGLLKHFRGRIERDDWVGQAQILAAQPNAARHPSQQNY